jgi:hypothetical protein
MVPAFLFLSSMVAYGSKHPVIGTAILLVSILAVL